jgi:class 3 adenylate cyclase
MTETRKLAAIVAADVVGFSRLTGSDEEGTLARLRALWSDLIAPTIAVHRRAIKGGLRTDVSYAFLAAAGALSENDAEAKSALGEARRISP